MFKHLQEIDYKLYERYLTLEKNIKAGSNSFYDAYLDLQEQFVKNVTVFCDFDIKARETCGELLRRDDVQNFFKKELCVDDFTYKKMQDYTLKVNAHKHKGEKHIQIDTIVSYMRIIYDATVSFALYKKITINEFDANYFISIFGVFEKENTALKTEMIKLKEELLISVESGKLKDSDIDAYRSLLSQTEIEKLDLEEQNQELHRQISKLKDSDIAAYKSLISQSEIEKLDLEEQNKELHRQISKLKDIKLSSMEEKLNKTIELLYELTESVAENRVMSRVAGSLICGEEDFLARVEKVKSEKKDE